METATQEKIKCSSCGTELYIEEAWTAPDDNHKPALPNTAWCPNKECGKWYDTSEPTQ